MNRKFFSCLAAIAFVCVATTVSAQPDPNYTLSITDGQGPAGGTQTLSTLLDIASAGGDLAGWSYGVCHDPAQATVGNIGNGNGAMNSTSTAKNMADVDFNEVGVFPDGFTQGVVICFTGCAVIAPGATGFLMATADYTTDPGLAEGTYPVAYCDETLGMPPVANVVVVMGASIEPVQNAGSLNIIGVVPYRRGDANDDGLLNIADGVWMLNDLFQGGPHTDCDGANDANDDASFDASDAISIFNYQFMDGPAPAAPFPDCGATTVEACSSYNSCP